MSSFSPMVGTPRRSAVMLPPSTDTPKMSGNHRFFEMSNLRVWSRMYTLLARIPKVESSVELSNDKGAKILKRLIIMDDVVISYTDNCDLMINIVERIRRTPECRIHVYARGFSEDLMKFLRRLPKIDDCRLSDVTSEEKIDFGEMLEVLTNATQIE